MRGFALMRLPPHTASPNPHRIPASHLLAILGPGTILIILFLVPFATMVAVSFFRPVAGGFYEPALVYDNYSRFLSPFFLGILGFTLVLAGLVAVLSVALAFPFTFFLAQTPRKVQVPWLVFVLAVLSLSEVIIGFAWGTLLSQTAGITNLFVTLGLMENPVALTPSFGALLIAMIYQAFPYAILVLYPALSRIDPHLTEAARTLGSSPIRAFFSITVPNQRRTLTAAVIMVFVFALGSYLLPQILGRPHHWTLSVMITDQAIQQSNMPFAAAMAVLLVVVSLALVGLVGRLGRERRRP